MQPIRNSLQTPFHLTVEQGAKNIIRLITDVPASLTDHYLEASGEIPW